MELTAHAFGKLKPRPTVYCVTDSAASGLQLVVRPSGKKSWRYRFRFRSRVETLYLGRYPEMTLRQARVKAQECAQQKREGINPSEARRQRRKAPNVTVREFGERWMADIVTRSRKDPTVVDRYLKRDIYPSLGSQLISSVTGEDVQKIIFARRDLGYPEAAAAIRHLIKRLFDYARVCHLVQANPVDQTPLRYVTRHKAGRRYLTDRELKLFFQGTRRLGRQGIVLELLLLTLARKSELRLARWEHVDFEKRIWEIPPETSKTDNAHVVYLSHQAVDAFRKLKGFAGRAEVVLPATDALTVPQGPSALNKAIARERWGFPHFTPHDLRRTASTILHEQGYNPDWIERAMNHVAQGVRGTYNRAKYADDRKRMLQEWANWLDGMRA